MNHVKKQGFTLIELMLAMAFIAMLLLAIALIIIQIGTIYNRGLTINEATQASSGISSDLSSSIGNAASFSLAANSGHYITQAWGGALCTGSYSYVWNFGSAVYTYDHPAKNQLPTTSINLLTTTVNGVVATKTPVNFAKVIDAGGSLCKTTTAKTVDQSSAVELLKNTDHDLAIHEFCIVSQTGASDPVTGEQLYTINYDIGTNDTAALTTLPTGTTPLCTAANQNDGLMACKAPGVAGSNLEYCTTQEFSLVVRTQNGVN